MARKMHCTLQEIGQDSSKVSEAGTNSISTIHQQQNNITPFQDRGDSSVSSINSDSGCAVLTFLNFDPDGNWRIVAIPVRCVNHINLASGVHMDGLQLLFPPPVNRLKIDQCKGPRGPLPHYAYSAKSFTRRNVTASNVRRRCQNKIAKKASKLNELNDVPGNSCSQSLPVCSSGLFPDSAAAVNSSEKVTTNSKEEDKSLKKSSKRRTRKKVRPSKKNSSDSGSNKREVPNEENVSVSLSSETCSSNDVDKELSSSGDRLLNDDCERNEISGSVDVREAPKSCNSYIDEVEMSKDVAPIIQNSVGDSAAFDRETKDIEHIDLCCYNEISDSLVLDSVSVGSNSDGSTKAGDIGKQSNKACCRTASKSGDGYFLGQNVMNGIHNNGEPNEGVKNDGQSCVANDNRAKQKRPVSKSSSFNKFGGVGIPHSRTGKENSHSVWQKVQKNGSDECGGDLTKVNPTLSQFGSSVKRDPSIIRKSSSASVSVISKAEDKKQVKSKAGRKSKVKVDSVSKKGQCSYSRKGSNFNAKDCVQQYDTPHVSSQENSQQGLTSVSRFNSDTSCPIDGPQTNIVEQITSDSVQSSEFHLGNAMKRENIDIQDSSLAMPCENVDQSNIYEEQSLASYNLLGVEAGQTEKEVSYADYNNAQSHSSGTTLWKWIPIGKKDTGLTKSDSSSSSPEYSDAPPGKKFNLESDVELKVDSFSQNQDSSLNASRTCMDQVYRKLSCLDEGKNKAFGNQVMCTVTERTVNHESDNQMIYEIENQEDTLENDSYRIAQAVNDACRAQEACEAVHMATGGPIAEIERLLHFCSPVICQKPNSLGCFTCPRNNGDCVPLCRHQIPDLSLGYLWQWYEKHGSYGLEIRAQDIENPKRLSSAGHFPFHAYFVPSLSAVQLFKNTNQCVSSGYGSPNSTVSEACEMVDNSEHSPSSSQHPIFSVLFPQPQNQDTNIQTPTDTASVSSESDPSVHSTCSGDLELLYEYFELEQPQQRLPLYEKIQDLVGGDTPIQCKTYGDPTILESINLRDLHPSSWYAVAWYPIYRIPDGNFRASFLTYHSLGHLVRRRTNSDSPTVGSSIVSPAVGLQSYNAQGECWFQLKQSALAAETLGLNPSLLLKERLRTLEESASLMAKAVVNKGNQICTNRHPDYEFFLSRRRY